MAETTARNIRVPDELWDAAKAKARSEYRTVTDVMIQALRDYVGDGVPAQRPAAEFEAQRFESAGTPAPSPESDRRRRSLERMQQEGQRAGLYEATAGPPPKRPRRPAAAPEPAQGASGIRDLTQPRKEGRYPCCKHCKVPHGGHGDPCANGCGA